MKSYISIYTYSNNNEFAVGGLFKTLEEATIYYSREKVVFDYDAKVKIKIYEVNYSIGSIWGSYGKFITEMKPHFLSKEETERKRKVKKNWERKKQMEKESGSLPVRGI